jgi:3'(2'), 5'-bisphosphate nucleotidase
VRSKADASPVTAADDEAEAIIVEGLRRLTPEIAVVSEEAFARGEIPPAAPPRFWLVDPLDGTKEFSWATASSRSISR